MASQIAHALKLPRVPVVRRLEEPIKQGYVERIGNAYRVTDKVNIPDLQKKLQRRIDMVAETAKSLAQSKRFWLNGLVRASRGIRTQGTRRAP